MGYNTASRILKRNQYAGAVACQIDNVDIDSAAQQLTK